MWLSLKVTYCDVACISLVRPSSSSGGVNGLRCVGSGWTGAGARCVGRVGLELEPDMHLMHGHTHTIDGGITWKCKTVQLPR